MKQSKPLLGLITFGFVVTLSGSVAAQSLRQQARQGGGKPVGSGILNEIFPKSIEGLTTESDVVLIATLLRGKSYLTPNEEHIYTDYTMSEIRVVAGSFPSLSGALGATIPLTITKYGGELILEGVLVRSENYNLRDLPNGQYLLFLKGFGTEAGRYQIYHGGAFAIEADKVRPVVSGSDAIFPGIKDSPVNDLVSRIQNAAKSR